MFPKNKDHSYYMREAIREARKALAEDEVPIGCIIVHKNEIIARAHNQREALKDPTAHAEMIAITQASSALESWRLIDTTLYVTLEPCPMCAGALVLSRIPKLVYGAEDIKGGACTSHLNIPQYPKWNHKVEIIDKVLEMECGSLLSEFFQKLREKK
ncbi:MAG: tRNA adenosine(34) deaminase TadA [Planctomycetota bacterium]|nr:MAG: tRNA adenosine(34) deaminase TadA [Planctomycetota bacterium]